MPGPPSTADWRPILNARKAHAHDPTLEQYPGDYFTDEEFFRDFFAIVVVLEDVSRKHTPVQLCNIR